MPLDYETPITDNAHRRSDALALLLASTFFACCVIFAIAWVLTPDANPNAPEGPLSNGFAIMSLIVTIPAGIACGWTARRLGGQRIRLAAWWCIAICVCPLFLLGLLLAMGPFRR